MARRRKRRPEASGPPGAPEWIVTFSDMISLLVTFFVMLMTFSSLEAYEALKVDAWLSGNRGFHRTRGFVLPELPENDLLAARSVERGAHHPHSRPPEKLPESLEEMGKKLLDDSVEVDFNTVRDGLVIELGEETAFEPGSTRVVPALEVVLAELGEVRENYPHAIVVEGFTDGRFRPTPRYPTAEALSVARARAAADALLRLSDVNPDLVQVTGHGDRRPRADDFSVSGRRLNRRVQVRVLALSRQRELYLQARHAAQEGR